MPTNIDYYDADEWSGPKIRLEDCFAETSTSVNVLFVSREDDNIIAFSAGDGEVRLNPQQMIALLAFVNQTNKEVGREADSSGQ